MQTKELSLVHLVLPAEDPDTEKPPLLLMLHGYGSHENDLFSMAPMLNKKATVVSVRAPRPLPWGGFAWYDIQFENLGKGKMSDIPQARESYQQILDFLPEVHQAYGTDPDQCWLMGFSQGCILSYALALNNPAKFQKVLALSGYMLKELLPEKFSQAALKHLDFFVSHGTADEVIPVEWARTAVDILEKLQLKHQYREYPMGHGINPECFEDLKKWMKVRAMI